MVPALISSGQGHSQEIHDQQQSLEGLTALETGQMAFGRRSLSEAKEKVGVELWLQPPSLHDALSDLGRSIHAY